MAPAFTNLTLVDAANAIARGETTSRALTEQCLARLKRIGSTLNCVIRLDEADALAAAEDADRRRARGEALGPLHGVPLAHKDLYCVAGKRVTYGAKILADHIADRTATALERLASAGALNLGGLHLAEFAFSPSGYNEHFGHARNPWHPEHIPGGSSSGSGAAVAARLIYGSLGTDTGGSLRHPGAMCGVTALKPTQTRVSRYGVLPLSFSLDCAGPIAQSARDCARLLRVIAGRDERDATCSARPVPDYEAQLSGELAGVRIAVPRNYYYDPVGDDIRKLLDASLDALRERGATIVASRAPDMGLVNTLAHIVMAVEAATIHQPWLRERPNDYAAQVRNRIEPGLYYPGTRYVEALSLRAKLLDEFLAMTFANADLVHLPAIPIPTPTIAATTSGDAQQIAATIGLLGHCTRGINYLGLPAVSVPMGFTANALPAGFQLVGRPFAEGSILRAADAYQRVTDWHRRLPAIATAT